MKDYKTISYEYFRKFSNKSISSLEVLFDKDIELKDWEIEAKGIKNVLEANNNIFKNVNSINVIPKRLIVEFNIVSAEVEITINEDEIIEVVDIIEFNNKGLITKIRAYKG